ncbi:MAG: response regulator [Kouleothrix sp.]|nr:response regulator [Kouleothrix sp.]
MKTVLVVDDEQAIAEMLRALLEGEGYRVIAAANGRSALAQLASTPVDLVISDLMMPILDGQDLTRAMRSSPSHQTIPLVLMSAVGTGQIGADVRYQGFLAKPFGLDDVLGLVERLIGPP